MNQKPSLYFPLQRALITLQQIEENEGELNEELSEQFTLTQDKVGERAEKMLDTRCEGLMIIAEAERRIEREKALIVQTKRALEHIDRGLKSGVELLGPINAGPYKVSLRKSEAVIVTDFEKVPDEYRKPIVVPKTPEKGEPDKDLLKKALKALSEGEQIEGVYLEKRNNLIVK